jgi:signal transduction histidine kinase
MPTERFVLVMILNAAGGCTRMLRAIVSITTLIGCLAMGQLASAATPAPLALSDLNRRTWGVAEGVPPFVQSIAIDREGFLWLQAATGLFRFDGVRFELIKDFGGVALPLDAPRVVSAAQDGAIWAGYSKGRVVVLRNGSAQRFTPDDGLPSDGSIEHIAFSANGIAWASTTKGAFQFHRGRWRELQSVHITGQRIDEITVDSRNRVWIMAPHGLFILADERGSVEPIRVGNSMGSRFVEGPDRNMWLTDGSNDLLCRMQEKVIGQCWKVPEPSSAVFDRDGALLASSNGRLTRIPLAKVQLSPSEDNPFALSETLMIDTNAVLLDEHQQIWVVGDSELSRFRKSLVTRAATPSGAIAAGDGSEAWVASFNRGLARIGRADEIVIGEETRASRSEDGAIFLERGSQNHRWVTDPGRFERIAITDLENRNVVLNRYAEAGRKLVRVDRDRNGVIWVGAVSPARLFRGDAAGHFVEEQLPQLAAGALIRGVAVDRGGTVWLAVRGNPEAPIYTRKDGRWEAKPAFGLEANAFVLDRADRPWIGTTDNRVAYLSGTSWTTIGEQQGMQIGSIAALAASEDVVWAGGTLGIVAIVDGAVRSLRLATTPEVRAVTGLLVDDAGNLWMNAVDGLLQVSREEIRRSLSLTDHRASVVRVDRFDGVQGFGIQGGPYPSLARNENGRLWFTTSGGLYTVEPAALKPAFAPRSFITEVVGDDRRHAATGTDVSLPPHTQRLTLRFTAPHLMSAERIQFRYRLSPFEKDWQAAGSRREAVYTNLDPGSYGFEVAASNDHGEWLGQPAKLSIHARPAFTQTRTFIVLCISAAMVIFAAAYWLRLRQVSDRLVTEANARHAERERIARELHDTLLQGMQGLILKLHAITRRAPDKEWSVQVAPILDDAEAMLEEGRDRVHQLNRKGDRSLSLAGSLSEIGLRLTKGFSCRFEIHVAGQSKSLRPDVEEELVRLASEAISNAVRHSQCGLVKVEIDFYTAGMALLVADNGSGIDPDILANGKPGHFGLRGMRQRASLLGASFTIRNAPGGGTQVVLQLPVSAYA